KPSATGWRTCQPRTNEHGQGALGWPALSPARLTGKPEVVAGQGREESTSGAKARAYFQRLVARLKSCPSQRQAFASRSSACRTGQSPVTTRARIVAVTPRTDAS